jgi:glycerate kinase
MRLPGCRTVPPDAAPATRRPDPRQILVAPDAFKGTFSATVVAAAIARGIERAGLPQPDLMPVADGGEGTIEVLLPALGGETAGTFVRDPLGRERRAGFALLEGGSGALVETAQAIGLGLVEEAERDAEAATSHGAGDLIAAAIDAGAEVVFAAVGGSATTDGGAGAIEAIEARGGLRGAGLVVLCDVRVPFELAAERFAPQKGAGPAAVRRLSRRLDTLAATWDRDPRGVPLTGCAGGLSGGLWARFGAQLEPGAAFVLRALDADARMRASRALVVGEGRLDATTLDGKIAGELATRARQGGVPCHAIVGSDALDRFGRRMIDLQTVCEAPTIAALEAAGEALAAFV